MKFYSLLLVLLSATLSVWSIPASPYPTSVTQPDGSSITILLHGDEFFSYTTTQDGFLINKNSTGIYEYAQMQPDGTIVSLQEKANNPSLRQNKELLNMKEASSLSTAQRIAKTISEQRIKQANIQRSNISSDSTYRGLVILVNFSDVAFITPNAQQHFTAMLNSNTYNYNRATGSARDYFIDSSDSLFYPSFDVYGPYTLPNTMSYYGRNNDANASQMIEDACSAANNDVDFSLYSSDGRYLDNVYVFYAGYAESNPGVPTGAIWPHKGTVYPSPQYDGIYLSDYACSSELDGSSGNTVSAIGTFCHEFGHVLGLPDLYNTAQGNSVLGYWDVMDIGCYLNDGRTPNSYSSYERFFLGWLTPTELTTSVANIILNPLNTHNEAYLITEVPPHNLDGENPSPTEFYMLENRQKTGWDAYLPGHGMLITRINYSASKWRSNTVNNTPSALGVEIIRADGTSANNTSSLAGDPFPGTTSVTGYNFSRRDDGVSFNNSLTNIVEQNGIISFTFSGNTSSKENISTTVATITQAWELVIPFGSYKYQLFNMLGQRITEREIEGSSTISNAGLGSGIYLLRVIDTNNQVILNQKIIKH